MALIKSHGWHTSSLGVHSRLVMDQDGFSRNKGGHFNCPTLALRLLETLYGQVPRTSDRVGSRCGILPTGTVTLCARLLILPLFKRLPENTLPQRALRLRCC